MKALCASHSKMSWRVKLRWHPWPVCFSRDFNHFQFYIIIYISTFKKVILTPPPPSMSIHFFCVVWWWWYDKSVWKYLDYFLFVMIIAVGGRLTCLGCYKNRKASRWSEDLASHTWTMNDSILILSVVSNRNNAQNMQVMQYKQEYNVS